MDIFSLLSVLRIIGVVSALITIACLIPVVIIHIKAPPARLREIIRQAQIQADPRHRKAVLVRDEEEEARLKELLAAPSATALKNWQGSIFGKELTA